MANPLVSIMDKSSNMLTKQVDMSMQLEDVACDLCGNSSEDLLFVENGFRTVKCCNCGLIYLNPRPVAEQTTALYLVDYFAGRIDGELWHLKKAKQRLRRLQSYCDSGSLLEIGCATGVFLHAAQEAGYSVRGIEIGPAAAAYARDRFSCKVDIGTLERVAYPGEHFDIICFFDVLSHVRSPKSFFTEIARIMKPNGILYARVGDKGGLWEKYREGKWGAPEHLYHFSRSTLNRLLCETGLVKQESFPAFDAGFPYLHQLIKVDRWPLARRMIGRFNRLLNVCVCQPLGLTEDYYLIARKERGPHAETASL